MKKSVKNTIIISSYIVVAVVFFVIGGYYYDDMLNIINKKSTNQIDIIGKQYALISDGNNKYFPIAKNGERIVFKFLDNSNIDFRIDNNETIITNCSISYYKSGKNRYYYSFTGCKKGYVSGDSDKLSISIKNGYFCVMNDNCQENERFMLIN